MTLAIKVLNMIKDDYSFKPHNATVPIHRGIPLTSDRWRHTSPYYAIYGYSNGREDGFAIQVGGDAVNDKYHDRGDDLVIIFSEYRSSDGLVVWHGLKRDFPNSDDMIRNWNFDSDQRWREQQASFSPTDKGLKKASEYIGKRLFERFIKEVWVVNDERKEVDKSKDSVLESTAYEFDIEDICGNKHNAKLKKLFDQRMKLMTTDTSYDRYENQQLANAIQDNTDLINDFTKVVNEKKLQRLQVKPPVLEKFNVKDYVGRNNY